MSDIAGPGRVPITQDAGIAFLLMSTALFVTALLGQGASSTIVGIISFCILLMIAITSALFLFEGHIDRSKRGAIVIFCLPAIALLGFAEGLFLAGGFWLAALITLLIAFAFASYRRLARDGVHNLIPAAVMDVGVVGGVGAAGAGFTLFAVLSLAT